MDSNVYVMRKMEEKLVELMGQEAFSEFVTQIAREAFRAEVDEMADGDFKDYIIENFDDITR